MKSKSRMSLAEAARRLAEIAAEMERGVVRTADGEIRVPEDARVELEVESERKGAKREVEVEVEISYLDTKNPIKRAAAGARDKGAADWARTAAGVVVLVPAILTTVRFLRSLRQRR